MGLYGFKKRFVPFILDGTKTHTIRTQRAHPDIPGNVLHLYTGLRQKGAKLLGRFICTAREDILITADFKVFVNANQLTLSECHALAWKDGFRSKGDLIMTSDSDPDVPELNISAPFEEMKSFWTGREFPFVGHIIHWRYEKERVGK